MHNRGLEVQRISTKSLENATPRGKKIFWTEIGTCTQLLEKLFGARRQLLLTFSGTTLIGLAVIVAIALYILTFRQISDSLHATAVGYRNTLPEEVLEELANSFIPIYRSVVRWRSREGVDGDWPPLANAYQDDLELLGRFAPLLYTELDAETHVRYTSTDGTYKVYQAFVSTGAALALQSDLTTPATNLSECAGLGIVQLNRDISGNISAAYQRVVDGEIRADVFEYDVEASSIVVPAASQSPVITCEMMMEPVWNATLAGSAFGGWTWSLNEQNMLSGSLPIFSANGSQAIGRMFSNVALPTLTVIALNLLNVLHSSWTVNGAFLLYTGDGRVIGQTESRELSRNILTLDELPSPGLLSRAISEVQSRTGKTCPSGIVNSETDDGWLIDSRDFTTEEYGMPPLSEGRWCILMILPRENLYGKIDQAEETAIIAGVVVVVVQLLATTLLALAVYLGLQSLRAIQQEKTLGHFRKVQSAVKDVNLLNCPMALISVESFLQLQQLEPHESLRNKGRLVILDSLEGPDGIYKFQEYHRIVFFSHQWVGSNFPDSADCLQLQSMKGALRHLQKEEGNDKEIYVWLDYVSIAQRHPKMMMAAVSSLPVYASVADVFVIVSPPVVHAAFGHECNFETYSMRGWCRAEMLAKACGSGLKAFYVCTNTKGELTPITDLSRFSLNVFEGDFTVLTDKESLVQPVLGLYSLVLRAHNAPELSHMQQIHEHISKDKASFFPRVYMSPSGDKVELFGPCVDLLEGAINDPEQEGGAI